MKKIKIVIEKTNTGFSAYAEGLSVGTTGENRSEVKGNIIEALNLYFEEEGRVISETELKFVFDLPQFFKYYNVINSKALAERLGMNQSLLAQYISGIKSPSDKQTAKILNAVKRLGNELAEVEFV